MPKEPNTFPRPLAVISNTSLKGDAKGLPERKRQNLEREVSQKAEEERVSGVVSHTTVRPNSRRTPSNEWTGR
jgi:hypothetical protein